MDFNELTELARQIITAIGNIAGAALGRAPGQGEPELAQQWEPGLEVNHSTLNRWVPAYAPLIERRLRAFRNRTFDVAEF